MAKITKTTLCPRPPGAPSPGPNEVCPFLMLWVLQELPPLAPGKSFHSKFWKNRKLPFHGTHRTGCAAIICWQTCIGVTLFSSFFLVANTQPPNEVVSFAASYKSPIAMVFKCLPKACLFQDRFSACDIIGCPRTVRRRCLVGELSHCGCVLEGPLRLQPHLSLLHSGHEVK